MKYIEPDSIPELQYFPFIVVGMAVLGVFFFFVNKRQGFLAWSLLLILLGTLGIYDFYLWMYDYGHNLDPNAPIKIPGMVYQPPLFGQKMLLNFDAHSYPYWGSLFLGLAIALGLAASYLKWKSQRYAMSMLALLILFSGCSGEPQPISYGEDHCHACQMTIVDQRYGAEIVSITGKVFKFDAVECMLNYANGGEIPEEKIKQKLVTAYNQPSALMPAAEAHYLRSPQMPSPMGVNLTAFATEADARQFQQERSGKMYNWEELNDQFNEMTPYAAPEVRNQVKSEDAL